MDRDDRMAHTHDKKTIGGKIAYRKYIRDLEFETREVLERETSNKIIGNIGTWLDKTQLDDNQMTWSTDGSKRSKKHEPKVNPDPEPLSSDLSESSSSESRAQKKKSRKKKTVVSIGKMTCPTHLRAMIPIRPMTVIIDVNDANIRNVGKRIRSNNAQL